MSIAQKAIRGAVWNLATGVGSRVIGLVGTLILTRFIAPADYGEVSAASICVATASIFANFNFGQYIIAKKAAPHEVFHATIMHIVIGIVGLGGVVALRDQIGIHIDAPTMGHYVPGFALAAFIDRFAYTPERTLMRALKFKQVAVARGVGELVFTATAVGLAPFVGALGIVGGNVTRSLVATTLLITASNRREWLVAAELRWTTLRTMLVYCVPLSIGGLAEFASSRWDNLMVSRFFGPGVMGAYNLAYSLAVTPTGYIAEYMGDVLMPSFAQMTQAQRRPVLRRVSTLLALVVFPLAVGFGVIAPTVVSALFAPRWAPVAPMLTILSVLSIVKPLTWVLASYTQAQQRPRVIMVLGVSKVVVLLGLLATIGRQSPAHACAAVGVTFALHTFGYLLAVHWLDDVSIGRIIAGVIPPLVASALMAACVLGTRYGITHFQLVVAAWLELVIEAGVGIFSYSIAAVVIAKHASRDLLATVRKALARRSAPAALPV